MSHIPIHIKSMHLLFIFLFFQLLIASNLFAGNGLKTFEHTILDKIIEFDCATYNECYELLCQYIYEPVFLVIIKPKLWDGDCDNLNHDTRQFVASFDMYHGNQYIISINTTTLSEASKLLCLVGKDNFVTQVQYFGINCTFDKI